MTPRIPEHCATCPWLKSDQKSLDELALKQDTIIRRTTSDELEDIAREVADFLSDQFQDTPEELIEIFGQAPSAEQVAVIMRAIGGHALGRVTRQLEKTEHDIQAMSSWCKGAVELSTTRNGFEYSTTVCASQVLIDEDLDSPEQVVVRRSEIMD